MCNLLNHAVIQITCALLDSFCFLFNHSRFRDMWLKRTLCLAEALVNIRSKYAPSATLCTYNSWTATLILFPYYYLPFTSIATLNIYWNFALSPKMGTCTDGYTDPTLNPPYSSSIAITNIGWGPKLHQGWGLEHQCESSGSWWVSSISQLKPFRSALGYCHGPIFGSSALQIPVRMV